MNLRGWVRHLASASSMLAALTGAVCEGCNRPIDSPPQRQPGGNSSDSVAIPPLPPGDPPANESITLTVPLIAQETDEWCWAASAEMTMKFLGKDVSQCKQASDNFNDDCCAKVVACATQNGWCVQGSTPQFDLYGFHAEQHQGPLSWDELTQELSAGRPVPFTWNIGDDAHMMVVRGAYVDGGSAWVLVNDPDPPCEGNDAPILYSDYVGGYDHTHGNDFVQTRRTQVPIANNAARSTLLNANTALPFPVGPGFQPIPNIQNAESETTRIYARSVASVLKLPSGFSQGRVTYEDALPDAIINRNEVQRYRSTDDPRRFLHTTNLFFVPVNVDGQLTSVFVMKRQPGAGGGYAPIRLGNRPLAKRLAAVNWKQAAATKTLGIIRVPFLHVILLFGRNSGQVMNLMLVSDDQRLGVKPGTWQTPDKVLTAIAQLAQPPHR